MDWLEELIIYDEPRWFENDRDDCIAPLVAFLSAQTSLKEIKFNGNRLSEAQKIMIRGVVAETAPECKIEGELEKEEPKPAPKPAQKKQTGCSCAIFWASLKKEWVRTEDNKARNETTAAEWNIGNDKASLSRQW